MPDDTPHPFSIPADLQARLDAAGVTDQDSLRAALQHDPTLAVDLEAFAAANSEALAAAHMMALLNTFASVADDEQMLEFWRSVPTELEEPLIEAVVGLITQAEAEGDEEAVAQLRPRLEGFRQIHQAAREQQEANQSPLLRTLTSFLQAEDEAAAVALFTAQKALLQPYETQRLLDDALAQTPPDAPSDIRDHLAARSALLRRLRGAAPAASSDVSTPGAPTATAFGGDRFQSDGDQYILAAHAESGGIATVVNNLFIQSLERRWTRPTPPALERDAVPRRAEMEQITQELEQRGSVAISGRARTLAVRGMPGVGKTTVAHLLALELQEAEQYRDGVIWRELGPDFTSPDQAQAVLREWAAYTTNFFGLPDNLQRLFHFEPEGVRSLLAEHPRLLVVLDNVWSLKAIGPLRAALPPGAHLIVTTRKGEIANNLGAGVVEVGLLDEAEALDLFGLRLRWRPDRDAPDDQWALDLLAVVGRHALGLDVALGVLRNHGPYRADWQTQAKRLMAAVQGGDVAQLNLGEDDPGHDVVAVLAFSYHDLRDEESRRRFRALAAFAPEAPFRMEIAAAVWGCSADDAYETLNHFANGALLERLGDGEWRQHSLLRSFALALLQQVGEQEANAMAHANAYLGAMHAADGAQHYDEMLPAMPQLRHAFAWAIDNDLGLALDIAANCANLMQQFSLTREAGEWAEQLLVAAQAGRAVPDLLRRVYSHRATTLSELAMLPGEDRHQRLANALADTDEALRFLRADTAPLDCAGTQNNRANILRELATLPGENRGQRLFEALAAYDAALRLLRPDRASLDYATTQNNRANVLRELATLPGEDRRQRLTDALAAADDALRFLRADAPLTSAQAQTSRAAILSKLATLPGEDSHRRLLEALAAVDDALRFLHPNNAPLAYAQTQHNRANRLSDLAALPGEDRRQRLVDALAACDNALHFLHTDTAPLVYAATQNNRATILSELATLPGEDRRRCFVGALAAADDALRFRRPDNAPLDHAATQHNRAIILSNLATLPGEDRRQRLADALVAADVALRFRHPDIAPLDYAQTQTTRANRLSDLATLPGEDPHKRLTDALAAADDALRFLHPDNAPLDYAATQTNRATVLSYLATLPGEDRRQRLTDALTAYDDALRFRRPDNNPLGYAIAQNNRAAILSEMATLPGEDRRQRLYDALATYDNALRFHRLDNAPLSYAATQNNRALLLSKMATLPGEDRRQRLYDALVAYDDALRFRRADTAPLDYAQTQNNRANILSDLATLPGEDRRQRLTDALAAADAALRFRRPDAVPLDYAQTQNNRATILSDLATLPGEDRDQRLSDALTAYDAALRFRRPDTVPLDYATTLANRAITLSELASLTGEERGQRLGEALRCALEAVAIFAQFQQAQYLETGKRVARNIRAACGEDFAVIWRELAMGEPPAWLQQEVVVGGTRSIKTLLNAFAQIRDISQMASFWQAIPTDLEEPFIQAVNALIAQAEQAGDEVTGAHFRSRLEALRQVRDSFAVAQAMPEETRERLAVWVQRLNQYQSLLQAANAEQPEAAVWREIVALGEELLDSEADDLPGINWLALRQQVSRDHNILGNALEKEGATSEATAAYERAVILQDDTT